jgi:hypothetical protein
VIWLRREDGSNPVEARARSGTRHSFLENLDHGQCWKLRRLDRRDEDGVPFATRGVRRIQQKLAQAGKQPEEKQPAPEIPPPAAPSTPEAPPSLADTKPVTAVVQ